MTDTRRADILHQLGVDLDVPTAVVEMGTSIEIIKVFDRIVEDRKRCPDELLTSDE